MAAASTTAARALAAARASDALADALDTVDAEVNVLGLACDAVSRQLPATAACRAVAENEYAATDASWLSACARALAVHAADDGVCGPAMARAIAAAARRNLDDPELIVPSLHVLDRLYNGIGERRPSINCGRRASLLQLGMAQQAATRLCTTDDRLALDISAALDRLNDDDVATYSFASLVATVTSHVPRDVDNDDARLKLVRALAAAPNDDDENDPLASDACAASIVRIARDGRRTACDALVYLLQNGGARAASARRALRRAGNATPERWLRAAASQVGRSARSCLRVAGALVAMKGSASLTTSQAKRRTGDVEECLRAAQLALQTASSLIASPRNVSVALQVFSSAAEAACRAARDRGLSLARAFEDDYVQDRAPGVLGERAAALAIATLAELERSDPEAAADALEAALSLGGADAQACYEALRPRKASGAIARAIDGAAALLDQRRIQSDDGAPRLDFADNEAHAAAAQVHSWCRLAAALHAHEARARPADPALREALRPAVCAARASLTAATQLDLDALDRAVAFVAAAGVDDDGSSDGLIDSAGAGRARAEESFRPEGSARVRAEDPAHAAATATPYDDATPARFDATPGRFDASPGRFDATPGGFYAAGGFDAAPSRFDTTPGRLDTDADDRGDGRTETTALRRSLEGSQVALRRLAADLGSRPQRVGTSTPEESPDAPPPPRDALRRARAPDIIAVDDAVSPAACALDDERFVFNAAAAPADPRSPRPGRSPAFAGAQKRSAFFAGDEAEAFHPGGPVQNTPRSPARREVFADDYDEAVADPLSSDEFGNGHGAGEKRRRVDDNEDATEQDDVCAACGRTPPTMRCPCLAASYCSRECQRAHWRTHKRDCPLRQSRASSQDNAAAVVVGDAGGTSSHTGDRWSAFEDPARDEAYAASNAATYDDSAASGAGEDADDWSRAPTRDDVTAARVARQALFLADGDSPERPESPQEKFVRVWSAADEAVAARVFDDAPADEAAVFDDDYEGIEDVRGDLRRAFQRLEPATPPALSFERLSTPVALDDDAGSRTDETGEEDAGSPAASRAASAPVRAAYAAHAREAPVRTSVEADLAREAAARVREAYEWRSRKAPVRVDLTDAALDALLPDEGYATLAAPVDDTTARRASGNFAEDFPALADATAAVSSFFFGEEAAARDGRADLRSDERPLGARADGANAPRPEDRPKRRRVDDEDGDTEPQPWRQAVDKTGVPYFVSAATGATARAPPAAWLRATREGADEARIRSKGGWVEALDAASGRLYYANEAGASQWVRPAVFDDDAPTEDGAPRWVPAARRRSEEWSDDGDDAPARRNSRHSSTELDYRGPAGAEMASVLAAQDVSPASVEWRRRIDEGFAALRSVSTPSAASRLFPGAEASPPSATRDAGVGSAVAAVQSVGSGGASVAVQSVGSGSAAAATRDRGVAARVARTASVGTAASPVARDVAVGAVAPVRDQSSGGLASAQTASVGVGLASAGTATVGVGRAAPAMASIGVGRRVFAEVSSGSDDDDDALAPPVSAAAATMTTGPPPPRTPPPPRMAATALNSTPRAWGRADAWVDDSDSGDDGLEALLRGHEAGLGGDDGHNATAGTSIGSEDRVAATPTASPRTTSTGTSPPSRVDGGDETSTARSGASPPPDTDPGLRNHAAAASDDDADISVHAWRSVSSGGSSRPSAGSVPSTNAPTAPRVPVWDRLYSPDPKANKTGARPAPRRSPARPSSRAVEEADADYVSPRFLRRGDGRRCADAAVLGQELRKQDQRNRTVPRRRSTVLSAALELKKLHAKGGALHYRVWDPASGVDTSWPKAYAGPFEFVPGSGSKPRTKPAPVPRFRWRQQADDQGLPYYVDATTGDTVRAAPEDWVAFTQTRGSDLPAGVVRRVGSICEYLDATSGRVYYHDVDTSQTAWARPAEFAADEDAAHEPAALRSPNRLGGLRDALRRRADVVAVIERLKGACVKLVPREKRNLCELIDDPPDFAAALAAVRVAVDADDANGALVAVRKLVAAYDNLAGRVEDAAARALHAVAEPALALVRKVV